MAFVPGPTASRANVGDRGFLSRVEPPTRTKGPPFVPVGGSTRDKRSNPFIPGGNTNRDKRVTLLSRLVLPTRTKGPFYPGWCYQPGQKASPRDSSKGSYSILSHVYYLGELARKPCVEQEILGSNPVVSKKNFNVRHLLSRFFHPGQKPREAFVPEALSRFQNRDKSQFGTGTKGQICSSDLSSRGVLFK